MSALVTLPPNLKLFSEIKVPVSLVEINEQVSTT